MDERPLSAIELTALGILWKRGPCTAYAIMREFQGSTSTYYSGRASTIYPVIRRFLACGLAASVEEGKVEITAFGVRRMREWLSPPVPMQDLAHTADMLRLRVFYLALVPSEVRARLIDEALDDLTNYLRTCTRSAERDAELGDPFSALASEGVLYETRARIEWLRAIRDRVIELPSQRPRRRANRNVVPSQAPDAGLSPVTLDEAE